MCLFGFSESTCSGVSKISYGFFLQALLGKQVPQHDVMDQSNIQVDATAEKGIVEKINCFNKVILSVYIYIYYRGRNDTGQNNSGAK
jgi:hypothetical protein